MIESSNPVRAVETIERVGSLKEIEVNIGKIKQSSRTIDAVKKVLKNDPKTRYTTKKARQWLTIQVLRELGFKIYIDYSQLHNMPSWETALVYPGMCLLEGTNLSEGRGTTRPFEIFGAPWINGRSLCQKLNRLNLPGVFFRPVQFLPTFQKHRDKICEGGFIHVTDRGSFQPVLTGIALLKEILLDYDHDFRWNDPPYEYEYQKKPIDILLGNGWLRLMMEKQKNLSEIRQRMETERQEFDKIRKHHLLYD